MQQGIVVYLYPPKQQSHYMLDACSYVFVLLIFFSGYLPERNKMCDRFIDLSRVG